MKSGELESVIFQIDDNNKILKIDLQFVDKY